MYCTWKDNRYSAQPFAPGKLVDCRPPIVIIIDYHDYDGDEECTDVVIITKNMVSMMMMIKMAVY